MYAWENSRHTSFTSGVMSPMSLPSLPTETLLAIFNFATYVPHSLPPDIYSTADWFDPDDAYDQLEELTDSLAAKRTIVSVCRQWGAVATPLLYECLVISKGADIPSLFSALAGRQYTLASRVKRLDVAFDDENRDLTEEELALLPSLLRLLPNLAVLHVCTAECSIWPISVVDALVDTCAESLQVVRWTARGMGPRSDWLSTLIGAATNLRVLTAAPNCLRSLDYSPFMNQWEPRSGLHFDSLTVLDLHLFDKWVRHFVPIPLPSLRELHLGNAYPLTSKCFQFLTVHGQHLVRLTLHMIWLQGTLDLVRKACPRLQILEYHLPKWVEPREARFALPPVAELWLHCFDVHVLSMMTFFCEHLASEALPHLKAVRLPNNKTASHVREKYQRLLAEWRASVPVPLLDRHGNTLT